MYKHIIVGAAAALLCLSASAAYKDGVYEGEGQGNASKIVVQVKVDGGKVAEVKVLSQGETPFLFAAAEKKLLPAVVEKNGTEGLTPVSGASNSSKGIIAAVNAALAKAQ